MNPHDQPTPLHPPTAARRRYSLTATLLADAQLGSGLSGAGLQALIARDRQGRPVLWATHLEGLLREVALLRGEKEDAAHLLGCAGGQRQRATFTSLYCTHLANQGVLRVWRSTARASFDNRAPKRESLRAVEMIPRGSSFRGHVELPDDGTSKEILERWLREVDAVGQGRAAGAGRVRFTLGDHVQVPATYRHDRSLRHVRLRLRNLEPLCLAATATPSNLVPSLSYIPGRALLGAVAAWLLQDGQRALAEMVTAERVSFGDAHPLPPQESGKLDNLDVLPAPLALRFARPEPLSGDLPWWAENEPLPARSFLEARPRAVRQDQAPPPRTKGPSADHFLARHGDGPWHAFRPALGTRLRNGRPDPSRAAPLLFAVESIAEDTHFLADLFGPPEEITRLVEGLRAILERRSWLRIGRAGAPVEVVALGNRRPKLPEDVSTAYLTLTSDLLVRDASLRWYTAVPNEPKALRRFLEEAGAPLSLELKAIAQDRTVVRGFNGTARLWRLPLGGIRRGSVFQVSGSGVAELARAANKGRWLGERTHEGCGRFRLDRLDAPPGVFAATTSQAPQLKSGAAEEPLERLCQLTRDWCTAYAAQRTTERKPSLSQWMDLADALEAGDPSAITHRLTATTRGGLTWRSAPAETVLTALQALADEDRIAAARLFVRWLRTKPQQEEADR